MPQPRARYWWRLYPIEARTPREPGPLDGPPALRIGDRVVIVGHADRVRAVIGVEWHRHRQQYCYRVQTSSSDAGLGDPSYWFAAQLAPAASPVA